MAVHVELVSVKPAGQIFSVAHYWEQNGDLMRDPDMLFIRRVGTYFPISFRQDPGYIEEGARVSDDSEIIHYNKVVQAAQAKFSNMWMTKIEQQQEIVLPAPSITPAQDEPAAL